MPLHFTPNINPARASVAIAHSFDADYVQYAHASFGSPAVLRALRKGWLGNFPRLTARMLQRNQPNSVATAKGHLDQTRQNASHNAHLPSNLPTSAAVTEDDADDDIDVEDSFIAYTQLVAVADLAHADLTGRFPYPSRRGTQYILVTVFDHYIHLEPMSNRAASSYVKAFRNTFEFFKALGHRPELYRLDNETSTPLKNLFTELLIEPQYVPAGNHRANRAERSIRTAKNHIIATLSSTGRLFPLALWDELLPQIELTLNHLRPYGRDPTISAHHGLFGTPFDFLSHPIAPCGTPVLVYESPTVRESWAPHGTAGFYLGPALQHHRCYRVWITTTNAERISDSLAWFPEHFRMPGSSPLELLYATITELTAALQALAASPHLPPDARQPFDLACTSATTALRDAVALFQPPRPLTTQPTGPPLLRPRPPMTSIAPTVSNDPPPPTADCRAFPSGDISSFPPHISEGDIHTDALSATSEGGDQIVPISAPSEGGPPINSIADFPNVPIAPTPVTLKHHSATPIQPTFRKRSCIYPFPSPYSSYRSAASRQPQQPQPRYPWQPSQIQSCQGRS